MVRALVYKFELLKHEKVKDIRVKKNKTRKSQKRLQLHGREVFILCLSPTCTEAHRNLSLRILLTLLSSTYTLKQKIQ